MQSEQPSGQPQPSITDLMALVNGLQNQLNTQRTQLEQQITTLQTELEGVRSRSVAERSQVVEPVATSRRRLLKQAFAGVVGATALSVAAAANLPQAQAATFNFNGPNGATDQTSISGAVDAKPMFFFNNLSNNPGTTPNDPTTLPIGVYSASSSSHGVYGLTASGTGSGVFGASGTAVPSATNGFFANTAGGVVGSSAASTGTFGVSQAGVGVEGLSATSFGVAGISQQEVGGVFAGAVDAQADPNQGAPLRLVPRTTAFTGPVGQSYTHFQGELYVDKYARIYICNAGYIGTTGKVVKPTAGTLPGVVTGQLSGAAPSFQQLTPMVLRAGSPAAILPNDYSLHIIGELWYDTTTTNTYICTASGATNNAAGVNSALLNAYGFGAPAFARISTGNYRFVTPKRFPASGTFAPQNGITAAINIRQFLVSKSIPDGANAIGVNGVVTIYSRGSFTGSEYLQSGVGPTNRGGVVMTTTPGQGQNASSITIGLDANGVMNFTIFGTNLNALTFDVFGYYV